MTCADFKAQALDYALGTLDEDERAACDAHLREPQHDGCLEALREATRAVALIPLALEPIAPSPATWAVVEQRLDAAPVPPRVRPPFRRAALVGWAVAAVALILVAVLLHERSQLVATSTDEATRRAQCITELDQQRGKATMHREALELLRRPGARLVALAPQGGATTSANLIYHADETRAFLVGSGLTPPPGKTLQLWVIRGEQQIPSGILLGDATGALLLGVNPAPFGGSVDAFGVTVESVGGGATSTNHGPVVLYGKI